MDSQDRDTLDASEEQRYKCKHEVDRDYLLIPEILVESYDTPASEILRPAFDAVWQACGFPRSLNYDEQGNWQERR
jgi:hypothetical protein